MPVDHLEKEEPRANVARFEVVVTPPNVVHLPEDSTLGLGAETTIQESAQAADGAPADYVFPLAEFEDMDMNDLFIKVDAAEEARQFELSMSQTEEVASVAGPSMTKTTSKEQKLKKYSPLYVSVNKSQSTGKFRFLEQNVI